ncbi:MAG: UDP-N-acetylmuramoyl-tripeptide--D-alanyl-D-alanine ligase [Nitrospirota bacterium]
MNETEKNLLYEILGRITKMEIAGISIDSRNIKGGELFVALKGDRFDGHDFVPDAIQKGAWGALVDRTIFEEKFESIGGYQNILPVDDTLTALQELARINRKKYSIPLIGITGSNGKTTTKEMLASILKQNGPVLKNEGNMNNHIGVPLTLMRLDASHKAAVVEMGMSAPGEIETLARIAGPTIGVITNIGPAHLEFLGTLEMIAHAKGELLERLSAEDTAVLNADDPRVGILKSKFTGRIIMFGIEQEADVRATNIKQKQNTFAFKLSVSGNTTPVLLNTLGRHNIYNALAAAAAAHAAGMTLDAIKTGLEEFAPVAMRSEMKQLQGRIVFADYYNANPASMQAALATLMSLKKKGRSLAVLGDMLELGTSSPKEHAAIGQLVAELGIDVLITIGPLSKHLADGAIKAGMKKNQVFEAQTHAEAVALIQKHSRRGDAVLVKGSRGMKMEKILEEF